MLCAFLWTPCCQLPVGPVRTELSTNLFKGTMKLHAVFSTLFVCFSVHCSSSPADKPGCFRINGCKCILKDGSGVINLDSLGDADGFLVRLRPVPAENLLSDAEILLSLSPCQHFSQPVEPTGGDCTSVAACLTVRYQRLSGHNSHYINYGRHEGNEFHYNHTLKMLSVTYFVHRSQPMTVAHYHCNPNQSVSTIREQSLSPKGPLHIWVESPCACPNACAMGDLGLGTIFLIILFLSAAAYFIIGSVLLSPATKGKRR
uniref:Uncharacterized LOC108245775 n=1 Tax=Kryptolebias marmoratus TaxID=37003 RepID=A0A3Q3A3K1_KRYMA